MKLIVSGIMLCMLTGCASMFTGTSSNINVTSTPTDADCSMMGHGVHTPGEIVVPTSHSDLVVICKKEGYVDGYSNVDSTFNIVTLLNLINWYGFIIDFSTGAAWEYPSRVSVNLPKKGPSNVK